MFSGTTGYRTKPPVGVMLNPLHPLSQGLVGCWLFNEEAGSVAHDISGHGNHGTLTNMSTNAQGSGWCGSKFGGGLIFDGVNDYVDCGNNSSYKLAQGSIVLRLKRNAYDGATLEYIFQINQALNTDYLRIFLRANGRVRVDIEEANIVVSSMSTNTFETANTNWHDIIITQDGTGIKFYIDGLRITSVDGAPNAYFSNHLTAWDTIIGGASSGYGNVTIDSACIYNRALSAAEIKQLYEDPFCNLLRVPVRYAPAALGGLSIPVAMNYYRRRRIA